MSDRKVTKPKRRPTGNYPVGYARAPSANQFQKGKSGNPMGRPKGSKHRETLEEIFAREAFVKRKVMVGGKPTMMTAMETIYHIMMKEASKGKLTALKMVMQLAATVPVETPEEEERRRAITDRLMDALQGASEFSSAVRAVPDPDPDPDEEDF